MEGYNEGKVFPAIRDAYKQLKKQVVIQINGAKPHIKSSIQASIEAECSKKGYNITLERQPAQNPHFNVLDLGFFLSLQVQASKIKESRNLQDFVDTVTMAFYKHDSNTFERMWQALFHVFDAILFMMGVTTSPCLTLGQECHKCVGISRGPRM